MISIHKKKSLTDWNAWEWVIEVCIRERGGDTRWKLMMMKIKSMFIIFIKMNFVRERLWTLAQAVN